MAPPPPRPLPARALIVRGDGSDELVGPVGLVLSRRGVGTETTAEPALFDLSSFGAVVVLGDHSILRDEAATEALSDFVGRGRSLVVVPTCTAAPCSRLSGVVAGRRLERGEWFAKVALGGAPLTERVPPEFPVVDRPVVLEPQSDDVAVLFHVSVGYEDLVVASLRRVGDGRVVVLGVGTTAESLSSGELATVFCRVLGPPEGLESTRTLGLGVLGYGPYGGMGLYHGLAARETPGLEIVAACDSDPARRKAAASDFPGLRPYGSVEDLLNDEEVDVVVVATPPTSHFELARRLLEAGKHVALEKPMCLGVAEADQLIVLAEAEGLALTVHQSRRWDPDFRALLRAVEGGLIGELFNVETFVGGFEHPCRAWHSEASISGGAVYDWGSHYLDWILLLMGDFPDEVVAHGHKRVWHDVTNLDQVRVRLLWRDGREAEFLQSDVAAVRRPKFFVQGTEGTIAGYYRPLHLEEIVPGVGYVGHDAHYAEAPVTLSLGRYEAGYGLTETTLPPAPVERYGFHRNLADHLLLGEPLAVTASSAREVVALLEAAQRSCDEGSAPIALRRPGD